jgi:MFS family permease
MPTSGAADGMTFHARLDGAPIDLSSSGDPIVLKPDRPALLTLDMRNRGSDPAVVRHVQIRGTAFGITLMAYDFTINTLVPAGGRERLTVPVQFVDLGQQNDGLLPATMTLLNADNTELATQDFTVDVEGSPGSLMVIFTMIVAIATGVSIAAVWIAIVRRRLPPSRWRRGLRLGVVGAGVGITLTMALSLLLFMPPKGSVWIPLLLIPTLVGFVLGYVSPGPMSLDEGDDEVEDWMRATVPMESSA